MTAGDNRCRLATRVVVEFDSMSTTIRVASTARTEQGKIPVKLPTVENLATIRTVYQTQYRGLVGIPYEMRPGQSPKNIEDFSRNPPRSAIPRDYTDEWISLDERWNAPDDEREIVRAFVAKLRANDDLPMRVYEFTTLPEGY